MDNKLNNLLNKLRSTVLQKKTQVEVKQQKKEEENLFQFNNNEISTNDLYGGMVSLSKPQEEKEPEKPQQSNTSYSKDLSALLKRLSTQKQVSETNVTAQNTKNMSNKLKSLLDNLKTIPQQKSQPVSPQSNTQVAEDKSVVQKQQTTSTTNSSNLDKLLKNLRRVNTTNNSTVKPTQSTTPTLPTVPTVPNSTVSTTTNSTASDKSNDNTLVNSGTNTTSQSNSAADISTQSNLTPSETTTNATTSSTTTQNDSNTSTFTNTTSDASTSTTSDTAENTIPSSSTDTTTETTGSTQNTSTNGETDSGTTSQTDITSDTTINTPDVNDTTEDTNKIISKSQYLSELKKFLTKNKLLTSAQISDIKEIKYHDDNKIKTFVTVNKTYQVEYNGNSVTGIKDITPADNKNPIDDTNGQENEEQQDNTTPTNNNPVNNNPTNNTPANNTPSGNTNPSNNVNPTDNVNPIDDVTPADNVNRTGETISANEVDETEGINRINGVSDGTKVQLNQWMFEINHLMVASFDSGVDMKNSSSSVSVALDLFKETKKDFINLLKEYDSAEPKPSIVNSGENARYITINGKTIFLNYDGNHNLTGVRCDGIGEVYAEYGADNKVTDITMKKQGENPRNYPVNYDATLKMKLDAYKVINECELDYTISNEYGNETTHYKVNGSGIVLEYNSNSNTNEATLTGNQIISEVKLADLGILKHIVNLDSKDVTQWSAMTEIGIPIKSGKLIEQDIEIGGDFQQYALKYSGDKIVKVNIVTSKPMEGNIDEAVALGLCSYPDAGYQIGYEQGPFDLGSNFGVVQTAYIIMGKTVDTSQYEGGIDDYTDLLDGIDNGDIGDNTQGGIPERQTYTYIDPSGVERTADFIPSYYDENGNFVPAHKFEEGITQAGNTYQLSKTQNEDGTWNAELSIYDKDNPDYLKEYGVYIYDKNEVALSYAYETYNDNKICTSKGEKTFYDNGKVKNSSCQNLDNGQIWKTTEMEYDENGKVLLDAVNQYAAIETKDGYIYSESLSYLNVPKYDNNGNIINYQQTVSVSSTGEVLETRIVDSNGNYLSTVSINDTDGKIGYFNQKGIGDCGLLSTLKALSKTDFNLVDNNIITWNNDGSATVRLYDIDKGILGNWSDPTIGEAKYYTISKEDLEKGYVKVGDNTYNTVLGDNDVKAIELAFIQYNLDKGVTNLKDSSKSLFGGSSGIGVSAKASLAMLVGNDYNQYNASHNAFVEIEDLKTAQVASYLDSGDSATSKYVTVENGKRYITDVNGNEIRLFTPHAYTVENYDEANNTVTLTNPHNYTSFTISAEAAINTFQMTSFLTDADL